MVHPNQILESMEKTLRADPDLPGEMSFLLHEWDSTGTEAAKEPPLIELRFLGEPQRTGNSERRKIRDENGGVIGRLLRIPFAADIQVDVTTVAGSRYDAADLSRETRISLYRHDDARGPQKENLLGEPTDGFPGGIPLAAVSKFEVGLGTPELDTSTSSSTRRWTSTVAVEFAEEIDSVEEYGPVEYVKEVVWAKDGQMTAGDERGSASYDPYDYWP